MTHANQAAQTSAQMRDLITHALRYLNWQLIAAPKPVLEYAVVHEVCHLKHRDHSPAFWALVRSVLPDYESCKAWLDRQTKIR